MSVLPPLPPMPHVAAERIAEIEAFRDDCRRKLDAISGPPIAPEPAPNVVPFPTPAAEPVTALPFVTYDECRNEPQKPWLIKSVFATGEDSSVFGPPGCGKSMLLTDTVVHLGSGEDWRGYRTKQKCGSVYFAFERSALVRRRLEAYAIRDGHTGLPIAVVGKILNLMDPACVEIILATVEAAEQQFGCPIRMLVLDTFNKGIAAGGGDEDKAWAQNMVATNLCRIHERAAVHICGVGHTGKDETRGERGSNARDGHIDVGFQVSGGENERVKTVTGGGNDSADGVLTRYSMESVTLGVDEDGDDRVTGILSKDAHGAVKATKLTSRDKLALDALARVVVLSGQAGPMGARAVAIEAWRDELKRGGLLGESNPSVYFSRVKIALKAAFRIDERDGLVWQTTDGPIMPPIPESE